VLDALQPLRFLLVVFAGLVHREQARAIAFCQATPTFAS
jgi:hypothetical protein